MTLFEYYNCLCSIWVYYHNNLLCFVTKWPSLLLKSSRSLHLNLNLNLATVNANVMKKSSFITNKLDRLSPKNFSVFLSLPKAPAFVTNIRLERMCLTVMNTLAYCISLLICTSIFFYCNYRLIVEIRSAETVSTLIRYSLFKELALPRTFN